MLQKLAAHLLTFQVDHFVMGIATRLEIYDRDGIPEQEGGNISISSIAMDAANNAFQIFKNVLNSFFLLFHYSSIFGLYNFQFNFSVTHVFRWLNL